MIIDVVFGSDARSVTQAQNANPPGSIVRLNRGFSTHDLEEGMWQVSGSRQCVSLLRFRRIPFDQIFPFNVDSPLVGGSSQRLTTPEEHDIMNINARFVPGRANVQFINCGVTIEGCFLRNPTLRQKIWPSVSLFEAINDHGNATEISYGANPPANQSTERYQGR